MLPIMPTPAAGGQGPIARDIPSTRGVAMFNSRPWATDRITESYISNTFGGPP